MRVLSLFDGISCGFYALTKLGIEIEAYYSSEVDKFAIQASQKNFPNQTRLGDVRNWRSWEIDFSKIDLLIGGSPCQSFSFDGRREGFEGESGLIEFYFEILEYIKSKNPNLKFFLENVRMLKEWENIISQRLGVAPIFLDSKDYSPQQRKRLYWFNFDFWGVENKSKTFQSILQSGVAYFEKAHCLTATYYKSALSDTLIKNKRDYVAIPIEGEGGNGLEVKDKMVEFRGEQRKINLPNGRYEFRKLTPIECERLQGLPDDYTNAEGLSNSQRYKMIGNAWQVDTIIEIFEELKK